MHFNTPRGPNLARNAAILRVVGILRLLLRIEVVEVAEEFVEAMHRRQVLVAVAEMILAELASRVALRLEQLGERRVLVGQPFLGARQADLEQAGAEARLAGDERRASRRCRTSSALPRRERKALRSCDYRPSGW